MPIDIGCSQLRSGSAQCDLQLAVGIRQCPVRSGGRGRKEGWKDGWKDGRMERWMDGWKEGRKEEVEKSFYKI